MTLLRNRVAGHRNKPRCLLDVRVSPRATFVRSRYLVGDSLSQSVDRFGHHATPDPVGAGVRAFLLRGERLSLGRQRPMIVADDGSTLHLVLRPYPVLQFKLTHYQPVHFLDRIHRPASRAIAVGIVLEIRLENGFQHELGGSLSHSITDRWNAERALASTIRLRIITRRTGSGRYVFETSSSRKPATELRIPRSDRGRHRSPRRRRVLDQQRLSREGTR